MYNQRPLGNILIHQPDVSLCLPPVQADTCPITLADRGRSGRKEAIKLPFWQDGWGSVARLGEVAHRRPGSNYIKLRWMVSVSKFHIGLERRGKGSGTHKCYRACSQTVRWNVRLSRCHVIRDAAGVGPDQLDIDQQRSRQNYQFLRVEQVKQWRLAQPPLPNTPLPPPHHTPDSKVCSSEQNSTRTVKNIDMISTKKDKFDKTYNASETGLRSRSERGFRYSSGWNINDFLLENEVITKDRRSLL